MEPLLVLQARIKLGKRHLLEWDTLAVNQQQVWVLVDEKYGKEMMDCGDDSLALTKVKSQKARHFTQLVHRQQEERQQLLRRHQQEEASLEKAVQLPD